MTHPTASIAAISTNQSTYVYYYSLYNSSLAIRELALKVSNNLTANFAAPSVSPIVAIPNLNSTQNNQGTSMYAPLAAVASTTGPQVLTVFWAAGVVDRQSGYGALLSLSRNEGDSWPAASYGSTTGVTALPLGDQNVDPHT
jgi:hypothetical protein